MPKWFESLLCVSYYRDILCLSRQRNTQCVRLTWQLYIFLYVSPNFCSMSNHLAAYKIIAWQLWFIFSQPWQLLFVQPYRALRVVAELFCLLWYWVKISLVAHVLFSLYGTIAQTWQQADISSQHPVTRTEHQQSTYVSLWCCSCFFLDIKLKY